MNLPRKITAPGQRIEYWYDATGRKLKKQVTDAANSYEKIYAEGIEYKENQLEAVYTPEGRLVEDPAFSGSLRYEYTLKDHLGNARIHFSDLNDSGGISVEDDLTTAENEVEILQENHYYPFGMELIGPWYAQLGEENNYQYNGKELDEDLGLGWYHYGARMFDPVVGRFVGVDPIADQFSWVSVYNYAENKVPNAIDLWGLQSVEHYLREAFLKDTGYNPNSNKEMAKYAELALEELVGATITVSGIVIGGVDPSDFGIITVTAKRPSWVAGFFRGLKGGVKKAWKGIKNKFSKAPKSMDKKVPNPHGKKGGPDHQEKVKEAGDDMSKRGLDVEQEYMVKTPNGKKSKRFIDVVGKDPKTGEVEEMVQVGKQTKKGKPIKRERDALDDIEAVTKKRPTFKPYNKNQ